jgi:predicted nucleotidyltransferase
VSKVVEQEGVLHELTRRVAQRLQGRRYKLYLFGSRAQGNASPRSDYDLALWTDPPLDLATLARLRAPGLKETVEKEGVLLGQGG